MENKMFDCKYFDHDEGWCKLHSDWNEPMADVEFCNGKCPDFESAEKCKSPVTIRPDGVNELDPCIYEEIETHHNCTVHVLRCKRCGHIELMWEKEKEDEDDT